MNDDNPGPFIATVKFVNDPQRMGRLGVNIPAITNTTAPVAEQITWCQYLSPFYGAKSIRANDRADPFSYKTTQHSYGMWAVPPDIDTEVLVIFAKGAKQEGSAFWIGCVQKPLVNQQVPGYGASQNTEYSASTGRERAIAGQTNYGTEYLPAGEKNQLVYKSGETLSSSPDWKYPINDILADQLKAQGLVQDTIRGTTSSSARRESPSKVFGISTPGAIRPDSRTKNIGINDTPVKPDRMPGHSFVMDDGAEDTTNQLTRLRTASGHQLLMHDTAGVVYLANGSGDSWLEMSPDGKVMIYAKDGFNFRSDGDFDLHAGGDINFHAKHSIKFTAEVDLVNNAGYIMNVGESGISNSSQVGAIQSYGKSGITSFSGGSQMHGAGGQVHLAGSQVHFNSVAPSPQWGPTWLTPETAGIVIDESQNDVNITVGSGQVLKANTKKTKTSVSNLVTHEPFTRAPSAIIENVSQWQNPKEWEKLSKTPGTLEWMAQKNREVGGYVGELQLVNDAKKYISDNGGSLPPKGHPESILSSAIGGKLNVKNIDLGKAKKLSDEFTKKYNSIYKVKSVVENLSTDNLKEILVNKVTAGHLSSVSSISSILSGSKIKSLGSLGSKVKGVILGRSSANNLPPSMRGTMGGQFTQVGAALKGHATKAFKAIGSFFSGFKFSDIRLKEDIQLIGKSPAGINIYKFKYKHTDGTYQGVMAQEVPEARQMTDTGFYMVDYNKLDVEFRRLN